MMLQLFNLDCCTSLFQLGFNPIGLVFGHTFFDRTRRTIHNRFGFFKPQTGNGANDLNHLNLLVSHSGENHIKLSLLGGLFRRRTRSGSRNGYWEPPH